MSHIDDLIAQLCPSGVDYRRVGDVAQVGTGSSDRKHALVDGRYPFYVRSRDIMRIDSYEFDEEAVVIPGEGGIGEIFHYVNGRYALHQRAYRIAFKSADVDTKFAYHVFTATFKRFIMSKAVIATVTSIRKPMITEFRIPVPPLTIQREIAAVLDRFAQLQTQLVDELATELDSRSRQRSFYRDSLFRFGEHAPVRLAKLRDLIREPLANGRSVPNGSGYPVLRLTALRGPVVDVTQHKLGVWDAAIGRRFRVEAGDLLVVRGNGSKDLIARASMVEKTEEVAFPDTMIRVRPDLTQVSQRYLFHAWESPGARVQLQRAAKRTSGVWKVSQDDLAEVVLPVPTREEQDRIVTLLDKVDAAVNDLKIGLAAEIKARQAQYEYYRDKLLTFPEKVA